MGGHTPLEPTASGDFGQVLPAVETAAQFAAIAMRLEAERDELLAALKGFVWWGEQQCPCYDDKPNPCPLCGASIENLEGCKAAEQKFPRRILSDARAAIAKAEAQS